MPSIFLVNSWQGIVNLILMPRLVFVTSKVPPSSRHFIMEISAHCDSDGLVVLWLTIIPPLMAFILVTAQFLGKPRNHHYFSLFFFVKSKYSHCYGLLWVDLITLSIHYFGFPHCKPTNITVQQLCKFRLLPI